MGSYEWKQWWAPRSEGGDFARVGHQSRTRARSFLNSLFRKAPVDTCNLSNMTLEFTLKYLLMGAVGGRSNLESKGASIPRADDDPIAAS